MKKDVTTPSNVFRYEKQLQEIQAINEELKDMDYNEPINSNAEICSKFYNLLKRKNDLEVKIKRKQMLNKFINDSGITDIDLNNEIECVEELNVICRLGDCWLLIFQGKKLPPIQDLVGMRCLKVLLTHPGQSFQPEHLYQLVNGNKISQRQAADIDYINSREFNSRKNSGKYNVDDIITPEAISSIKKRLKELKQEIEEAEQYGDKDRYEKANEEYTEVRKYFDKAIGLHGKSRKFSKKHDSIRTTLQKGIKSAIKRIEQHNRILSQYLESYIRSGDLFTYNPAATNPIYWSC
jgi:hypothetical protein